MLLPLKIAGFIGLFNNLILGLLIIDGNKLIKLFKYLVYVIFTYFVSLIMDILFVTENHTIILSYFRNSFIFYRV